MSRFRLLLLGLLAVLAVGVVSAASASAESCSGGSNFVFCSGSTPLNGKLVLGLATLALLTGTITGATAKFHCADAHFHGVLGLLGASTGLILFLNCKMIQPAGCKLTAAQEKEINVLFTGTTLSTTSGLLTGAGGGSAEEFASLTVEAEPGKTCAATGTFTVNGGQLVETPEGGSEKVEHEIVAKNTGSMLTLGGNAAKFSSTAKVMLASGAGWFITGSGV